MSTRCPDCGGVASRSGTKARRVLDLAADGSPHLGEIRVQRWQCDNCLGYFSTLPAEARPRSLATIAARDAVAEACFAAGYAAAAKRFGIDEKTARSLWQEWAELRAADLPGQLPEFLGLHIAEVAGAPRTIVTDVEAATVLDVLPGCGAMDVVAWLKRIGYPERIHSAAIALHPPFRLALQDAAPDARVSLCPEHARNGGLRVFVAALRGVQRATGRRPGDNTQAMLGGFARPLAALSLGEREDMGAWDDAVQALHAAKECFLEALACNRPAKATAILAEARAACLDIPGAGLPAAFIASWSGEMAAGVSEAALGPFAGLLGEMAACWAARRPPLPFDLARGLAVLRDGPRVLAAGRFGPVQAGVAMTEVIAQLGWGSEAPPSPDAGHHSRP